MTTTAATTTADRSRADELTAEASLWTADGGLETWLLFQRGIDLPDFAAFPLLDTDEGRNALDEYARLHLDVARRHGTGFVVDTPTWRASPDWGGRLGYDRDRLHDVNVRAGLVARAVADGADVPTIVNGAIGPRGDGYVVGATMSVAEAASYHSLQIRAFAQAGVDMVTAVTMTYVDEAIGIVRAATEAGLSVAIGFTTETDGRLPSGDELGEAIRAVDEATDGAPVWFMVNCAHPTHFADALAGDEPWIERVKSIRANASTMSHEELDEAEELDRGDPADLADRYVALRSVLPDLRVVGGCCGTDHEHVDVIAGGLRRA